MSQPRRSYGLPRAWWRMIARTSVASWLATALAVAGTIAAARALGVESYGVVVLAIAITGLVAVFLDLTLEEAVVFHGSRALARGEPGAVRALLRTSLRVDIGIGVAVCAAIAIFAEPLAALAGGGALEPHVIRLAVLVPLVTTADSTTSAVILLAGRPDLRAWCMAAGNL